MDVRAVASRSKALGALSRATLDNNTERMKAQRSSVRLMCYPRQELTGGQESGLTVKQAAAHFNLTAEEARAIGQQALEDIYQIDVKQKAEKQKAEKQEAERQKEAAKRKAEKQEAAAKQRPANQLFVSLSKMGDTEEEAAEVAYNSFFANNHTASGVII